MNRSLVRQATPSETPSASGGGPADGHSARIRAPVLVFDPGLGSRIVRSFARLAPAWIAPTFEAARESVEREQELRAAIVGVETLDGLGVELLGILSRVRPALPVLVHLHSGVTRGDHPWHGADCVTAPAQAEDLVRFVRYARVFGHVGEARAARLVDAFADAHALSVREAEVVALALLDLRRNETAAALLVSENTVKGVIRALLAKCERESLRDVARQLRGELLALR